MNLTICIPVNQNQLTFLKFEQRSCTKFWNEMIEFINKSETSNTKILVIHSERIYIKSSQAHDDDDATNMNGNLFHFNWISSQNFDTELF